jgi:hypothetical protein
MKHPGVIVHVVKGRFAVCLMHVSSECSVAEVYRLQEHVRVHELDEVPHDALRLMTYRGPTEIAQGYVLGALDTLRLMLDMREAADSPAPPIELSEDDILLCPSCASPMRYIAKSARGPFFGCTNFPRCRGSRKPEDVPSHMKYVLE